jgi:hypothetical protein
LYTIKKRRKLRRAYFRSKDPALKPLINRLNHEIKALLKNENEAYWCKFCEQINTEEDPANFWKLFKRIGNPRNNQSKPIKYQGKTHCSDDSKASVLAATLLEAMTEPPSSLGPIPLKESLDLQSKITNFSLSKPSLLPENLSPDQEALLNEITIEEIEAAIKISPNKAPGPDNIFVASLKHLPEKALQLLHLTFNACLNLGHVPPAWKSANVTMIPKPDKDPSDPSSYRPISLLSSLQKLLERILTARLSNYLESLNLLTSCQSGF